MAEDRVDTVGERQARLSSLRILELGHYVAAPSNAFLTRDDRWFLIAANSDALFERLARLMRAEEMICDPRFANNRSRVAQVDELVARISDWTRQFSADALERMFAEADIPSSCVYTIADCAGDEQFHHRRMVRAVRDAHLGEALHPGIVPHFPDGH